jgi:PAS domain-containing protein
METLWTIPHAADFPGCSAEALHLLERMPDAIILLDGGGHIEFVNARPEQMFGYRREELAGKPVDVLVPGYGTTATAIEAMSLGPYEVGNRESLAATSK